MALKQKIQSLAKERNEPCVTISLNTHRTHPDNRQDVVILKNLLKEAEERVLMQYDKRNVSSLLENINSVPGEIDENQNLESLHIFLSNDTRDFVRSTWPSHENIVHVTDTFALRPLIKAVTRTEEYMILLLSKTGATLYEAVNDGVLGEITNDDFPYPEMHHEISEPLMRSDPKQWDNFTREYFNKIDKAVLKVHRENNLHCMVVCTAENYSHLLSVADQPTIYLGHIDKDYKNRKPHQIAADSWELIKEMQSIRRKEAIAEMKEAVATGTVITDLQEIYQASIDGRGELLMVHREHAQPVLMNGDRTFELVSDAKQPGAIDDITSNIAWEVLSKNGNIFFTNHEEIKDLGEIVLKARY